MAKRDRRRSRHQAKGQTAAVRSWTYSLFWAAALMSIGIVLSTTINPLFGRSVHWDWMAGIAPTGFASLAMAFRKRWV